ncbi:MAG: hypothetical protein QG597_4708 [Actinomycetota bacterium]|nr:hypothetical protein [Actinomycetota bacterium]
MPTIDTVAALLAKAERTDNADEADAYLAKAQHLATLHAIDLAALAAAARGEGRATTPVQRTIRVGEPRRHANSHLVALFSAIARPNDVLIDVARNSTYVIAYGLPDDVDTCESIWLASAPRMVESANWWMRSKRWQHDTTVSYQPGRGYVEVPLTARAAKATFMIAFIQRVGERLASARSEAIRDADAASTNAAAANGDGGAALVLVAKADQVRSFYRDSSSASGSWRGYSGSYAGADSSSARAGDAAGRAARLRASKGISAAGALEAG